MILDATSLHASSSVIADQYHALTGNLQHGRAGLALKVRFPSADVVTH